MVVPIALICRSCFFLLVKKVKLKKKERIPLPNCCYTKIRAKFTSKNYSGFKNKKKAKLN